MGEANRVQLKLSSKQVTFDGDKLEGVAMATRIPCLVVVVLVVLLTLASFIDVSDGFKLTPQKVGLNLLLFFFFWSFPSSP